MKFSESKKKNKNHDLRFLQVPFCDCFRPDFFGVRRYVEGSQVC